MPVNAPEPDEPERKLARAPKVIVASWGINVLAVLAVFASLYLASSLVLPLVLALMLGLLLAPLVAWLADIGIPHPAGAAIVIIVMGGSLVAGIYLLAGPASGWLEQVPEALDSLQAEFEPIANQFERVSDAADKVEQLTDGENQEARRLVQVKGVDLRNAFLAQAQQFLLGAVVLFFLLYFLLAGAHRLRYNLERAIPDSANQLRVFVILRRMQQQVSRYLLSITIINTGLGILVALMTWSFGMPNPVLWGAMAGLFNFVPYIGPVAGMLILTAVSVSNLEGWVTLAVPAVFVLMTSLEGQLITPSILGRNLALNPVFIFVALIFWGWLWGVIGALLAVPIMVSFKIVCDNVPKLQRLGMIFGR